MRRLEWITDKEKERDATLSPTRTYAQETHAIPELSLSMDEIEIESPKKQSEYIEDGEMDVFLLLFIRIFLFGDEIHSEQIVHRNRGYKWRFAYLLIHLLFSIVQIMAVCYSVYYFTILHSQPYNPISLILLHLDPLLQITVYFTAAYTVAHIVTLIIILGSTTSKYQKIYRAKLYFGTTGMLLIHTFLLLIAQNSVHAFPVFITLALCVVDYLFYIIWVLFLSCDPLNKGKKAKRYIWLVALSLFVLFMAGTVYYYFFDPIVALFTIPGCSVGINNQKLPVYSKTHDVYFCTKYIKSMDKYTLSDFTVTPLDPAGPIVKSNTDSLTPADAISVGCKDTFYDKFGLALGSLYIECPANCVTNWVNSTPMVSNDDIGLRVIGCEEYSMESSMCLSAIHNGAMNDNGGILKVTGVRSTQNFPTCLKNSITSQAVDYNNSLYDYVVSFRFKVEENENTLYVTSMAVKDYDKATVLAKGVAHDSMQSTLFLPGNKELVANIRGTLYSELIYMDDVRWGDKNATLMPNVCSNICENV